MNKQEVFNKVAKHLLDQNEKAYDYSTRKCTYRQKPNGLACAVGCLIPEAKYSRLMDFTGAPIRSNGRVRDVLREEGIDVDSPEGLNLLCSLQSVHDFHFPDKWRTELRRVAATFDLDVPEFLKPENDPIY